MAKLLKKSKVYCVMGGPGAGKGTCAKKLATEYELTHFSVGELLRRNFQEETGQKVKDSYVRGELVATDLVLQVLKETMIKEAATSKGFVIDGYPRDMAQYTVFEKEIAPILKVVLLKASNETLKARALEKARTEGRTDVTEEIIDARIAAYNFNLRPFIDNFKKIKKLTEIDAEGEADDVCNQCKAAIEKKK